MPYFLYTMSIIETYVSVFEIYTCDTIAQGYNK